MLGELQREGRFRISPAGGASVPGLWGRVARVKLGEQLLYLREGIYPVMGGSFGMSLAERAGLAQGHIPPGYESVLELAVPGIRSARFTVEKEHERRWQDLCAQVTAADAQHRRVFGRHGFSPGWAEALLAGERQLPCGHLKSQPTGSPHRPHRYHPACTACGETLWSCLGCVSQGERVCHSECFVPMREPLPAREEGRALPGGQAQLALPIGLGA